MQEDVKNEKRPWRRRLFWLAIILVAGSYFSWGTTHEFDLNSGRTRYTFTLYAIPLYWKTSETEFSRLLKAEGITTGDEPPQWVTDDIGTWIRMFPVRPGYKHYRIIFDCKTFCRQLEASRKFIPESECRCLIDLQWERVQDYPNR